MKLSKGFWRKFTWIGAIVDFGIALTLLVFAVIATIPELKLALCGLALGIASIAGMNINSMKESQKIDEAIGRLEAIRQREVEYAASTSNSSF